MASKAAIHVITHTDETLSQGAVDAIFPWWSFGKTVLALCALRLVAENRLALDSTLPGQAFTLRQALHHRAGLPDYGMVPAYHAAVAQGGPAWPPDQMIATARAVQGDLPPGGAFAYSNIGYWFVLRAIEAAADAPLHAVIRDQITRPLGLGTPRLAQTPADMAQQFWPAGRTYDPGWVLHGLLLGSARDAARLLDALITGRLLPPDLHAQMTANLPIGGPLTGRIWASHGYGLGLMAGTLANGGRAMGHSGAGPFSVNACYHFPDAPTPCTVVCFTNDRSEAAPERSAMALAYPSANNKV